MTKIKITKVKVSIRRPGSKKHFVALGLKNESTVEKEATPQIWECSKGQHLLTVEEVKVTLRMDLSNLKPAKGRKKQQTTRTRSKDLVQAELLQRS